MSIPNKGYRLVQTPFGYEIRWCEKGRSKRISARTMCQFEAVAFMKQFMENAPDPSKDRILVNDVLDAYWAEWVQEQVMDKDRIRNCLDALRPHFGTLSPCDLSGTTVDAYKKARGVKVKVATIRRELTTLIAALNHAVKQRRITATEIPHITMPPAPPPRDFWLNEIEEKQFLKLAADTNGERLSRVYRFVAIALATAARRHSIETLRWEQVDLEARIIRYEANGRRQKKKRRVPVPISDALLPVLLRAKAESQTEYVLDTPYSIQHHFEALVSRAIEEIGPKFQYLTIHDLRRTWATLAARAGVDLFQIAGVLGDTFATVERVYAHHSPDHLRKAVNFRA
jgi:integrase